jgi:hypothetical protein
MGVLFSIQWVNSAFSYRIFRSIFMLMIFSQLTSVWELVCRRVSHRNRARWRRSGWGECCNLVEDFRLTMACSELSSDSSHTKTELWNLFAGWYHDRSINQGRCHSEVNSSTPSKYFPSSLHGYTTYMIVIAPLLLTCWNTGWLEFPIFGRKFGGFSLMSW